MPKLTEEDVKNRIITPAIENAGWSKNQMWMEKFFTDGKVIIKGKTAKRGTRKKADYLLHHHNNFPIAIVEAKDGDHTIEDGIQQAIDYAKILDIPFAYSSNGEGFVEHDMLTGKETNLSMGAFPTQEELWNRYIKFKCIDETAQEIIKQPYYFTDNSKSPRYYQRIVINRTVEAVANDQNRIMVVMATGTGKTYTAFQIVHRLYTTKKVKKVLYLADRNILIDQTILNDFAPFVNKNILTKVTNKTLDSAYDIFMSLYHQLSGDDDMETFLQFSPDFFDLIIIDECHRGSAKDNSRWRKILDYFSGAIHIGMTATPKEEGDVHNSDYFGDAVYTYSLKEGIDDGFLAPYRVLRIGIDKDLEGYEPEDGKVDIYGQEIEHKVYTSKDFDRKIIIDERTKAVAKRITEYLKQTDRYNKTIVFCVDEDHAGRMRQALVNENNDMCAIDDRYVMRITGQDDLGKKQLENFIDNNSKYPTIVTTAELLSTGVDCKMCKVIVLDSVIGSMTKFKQVIGRGTRLVWDRDKRYFTILDFRKATMKFSDPEFDGPASSVYDVESNKPLPEEPDDVADDFYDTDEEEINKKYRVDDVDAKIISEVELLYSVDGKLIVNHRDAFKKIIVEKYPTEEVFHNSWINENKLDINNYFEERGIDFSKFYETVGKDVDLYDIILMVAYGKDAKLKVERSEDVKSSNYYNKLDKKIKPIIDELLSIYIKTDVFAIERKDVLKLSNFNQFGGLTKVARIFGGRVKYEEVLKKIIGELYN
ncbi:EcoAI/FtnUII family type I restriction enzme subunit R [Ruminiclostridium cellobioparum]|uniref:EcoAI/FtnUII family type I restriction enzme subunit R n=1 Tax=Ruminiclostridium cellobioparum TaxID=29355 RepID=UPI0028B0634A|nr:DEAD/DEAH box helicase family protein [Ruminiclostridium cellobioparum]